jgi:predicted aminopeptidase
MRCLISIPLLLLVCACSDIGYYWHSTNGHLDLMSRRSYIEDILADEATDPHLRERLLQVQEIRHFSIERLDLPGNESYRSYVALQQPYVIQNLFAAPEFSTQLHRWCYPVIGCASYRGYYDEMRLQAYVAELRAEGLEVYVGSVPAYSTLGWFDDPVLSSFIDWPDYRLAGLLFHELTHQRIYIDDDTTFNESLASAVQQRGTELWLQARNDGEALREFSSWLAYRNEVVTLIAVTRKQLGVLYAGEWDDSQKRERKARIFDEARHGHDQIAASHGIENGFRDWFAAQLNNAKIGSVSAYNSRVGAFVAILQVHGDDFASFYRYVEKLAKLERPARDLCLDAWSTGSDRVTGVCPVVESKLIVDA